MAARNYEIRALSDQNLITDTRPASGAAKQTGRKPTGCVPWQVTYDAASPPSAGAASAAGASVTGSSFGLTRSGAGSGWPKSLFLIFFRSVATRSLGVAPTDIQYWTRSMLS